MFKSGNITITLTALDSLRIYVTDSIRDIELEYYISKSEVKKMIDDLLTHTYITHKDEIFITNKSSNPSIDFEQNGRYITYKATDEDIKYFLYNLMCFYYSGDVPL